MSKIDDQIKDIEEINRCLVQAIELNIKLRIAMSAINKDVN